MIGKVITALLRVLQLHKLVQRPKIQAGFAKAKKWYDRQPREVQLIIVLGAAVLLVSVLLA